MAKLTDQQLQQVWDHLTGEDKVVDVMKMLDLPHDKKAVEDTLEQLSTWVPASDEEDDPNQLKLIDG